MFSGLEAYLISLAHSLPLEAFVFIASFIEEVIAPIPSAAVLLVTGSLAVIQGRPILALIPLVLIASLGKTIGALIVYLFSEKIGTLMITKFGRFFEITPADVDTLSKKITGSKKDYVLLTFFRALPILPSAILSIGCGILKVPLRIFIFSTVVGSLVRDGIFIYIGYTGTSLLSNLANHSTSIESTVQNAFLVVAATGIAYIYFKRHKRRLPPSTIDTK
jgi:membrane protein DedA with SNARE-associated domain